MTRSTLYTPSYDEWLRGWRRAADGTPTCIETSPEITRHLTYYHVDQSFDFYHNYLEGLSQPEPTP